MNEDTSIGREPPRSEPAAYCGSDEPKEEPGEETGWPDFISLFAVVLMSLTAVLTAWTGFQSAKWSGVQAIAFSEAAALRTESVRSSNLARMHYGTTGHRAHGRAVEGYHFLRRLATALLTLALVLAVLWLILALGR